MDDSKATPTSNQTKENNMITPRKNMQVRLNNGLGIVKIVAVSADEQWARVKGADGDPGWRHVSTLSTVPHVRKSRAKVKSTTEATEVTE
jgi:SH3-like domain-containing protein